MLTADVLEVEKLKADDLDFVDEGPGRFDAPVVRPMISREAALRLFAALLKPECRGCGGTVEADMHGLYCHSCVTAMES